MMGYDQKVPAVLKREQQWFGSIIARPINEDSRMNPISPSGRLMEEEAAIHIAPSPTLRPAQRIQIYNQQYWWRLLNTLQESFPLVTRLFGCFAFNRTIGIPYLTKYPPRHWSLAMLGDRLADWCREDYHSGDKELVVHAIELDWAFSCSFTAQSIPPLTLEQLSRDESDDSPPIVDQLLYLQPFIHLFAYPYDLFQYRIDFLKEESDYWLNHEFPLLDCSHPYHYVLFRQRDQNISWKKISNGEFFILSQLHKGSTLAEICEALEDQEASLYESAAENLQLWFQEWAKRGWLSLTRQIHNS